MVHMSYVPQVRVKPRINPGRYRQTTAMDRCPSRAVPPRRPRREEGVAVGTADEEASVALRRRRDDEPGRRWSSSPSSSSCSSCSSTASSPTASSWPRSRRDPGRRRRRPRRASSPRPTCTQSTPQRPPKNQAGTDVGWMGKGACRHLQHPIITCTAVVTRAMSRRTPTTPA